MKCYTLISGVIKFSFLLDLHSGLLQLCDLHFFLCACQQSIHYSDIPYTQNKGHCKDCQANAAGCVNNPSLHLHMQMPK